MCQAERAAAHCVPPEQRIVGDPGVDASGGGLTNQAKQNNKTWRTSKYNDLYQTQHILHVFSYGLFLMRSDGINKCTSKACWILSLLPARPGRLELKECVFSEICPPSRLSSGSRVSDHNLHTPSSQDVSSTLHTEPLQHNREMLLLTNQCFLYFSSICPIFLP